MQLRSLARTVALKMAQLFLFLFVLWGAAAVAFSGAALYVVLTGNVKPGEPMFLGDPAPTAGESLVIVGIGTLMIFAAAIANSYLKRVFRN